MPAREDRVLWFYLLAIVVILDGLDWVHERSSRVVGVDIALSVAIIVAAIVSEVRRRLRERRKSNGDAAI